MLRDEDEEAVQCKDAVEAAAADGAGKEVREEHGAPEARQHTGGECLQHALVQRVRQRQAQEGEPRVTADS